MKNIYFRNGVLIYYGNPAGYLSDGKVILDSIFDKGDIKEFLSEKEKLTVEVREGVYDRLSEGGGMEEVKIQGRERRIKIHQLKRPQQSLITFVVNGKFFLLLQYPVLFIIPVLSLFHGLRDGSPDVLWIF